ncbi:hypothetical protein KKB41_03745 [Patescibacteria group bacterium]|nr:hypothetical protein [Patescibacteria group bacterium]
MKKLSLALFIFCLPFFANAERRREMATEDTLLYKLEIFSSYIKAIKNSVGSKIFKNLFYIIKGRSIDALQNGNLSCAYFVSTILRHFDLIKEWRTSVDGLVEEMEECGWEKILKPRKGAVIVWEKMYFRHSGEWHGHIGFYIGGGWAISTSSFRRAPTAHPWQAYSGSQKKRKIIAIYWHKKLEKN